MPFAGLRGVDDRLFFGFDGVFRLGVPEYLHPFKPDGHTGLAAGGAGEQGQVPVTGGHGFFVVWFQCLPLYHLKGDHLVVHIRKKQGIPWLEGFELAKMGSVYMNRILKVDNPRIGLLNIGAERTKGTKTVAEAYGLLENAEGINFIGNVEGKELPMGACDVLVCDGFSGNIVLKLTEGCAAFLIGKLKDVFNENPMTKLSALGVKNGLRRMKKDFDASEYGGAPLLGLSKTVIKAHGSSDAAAIRNAVRQAVGCVENNVVYEIAKLVVPEIIPREKEATAGRN